MNAALKKYLEIQTAFFNQVEGKVMPDLPSSPNPRGERYVLTQMCLSKEEAVMKAWL
jgi:hypothetical protein